MMAFSKDSFIDDDSFDTLTTQMDLKATVEELMGALQNHGSASRDYVIECLENTQEDVQWIGINFKPPHSTYTMIIRHRHLQLDLVTITHAVRQSKISDAGAVACLEMAHSDILGLERYLKAIFPPIYWNLRRDEDCVVAHKVFAIPELLEMILSNCSINDVLNMYETCKEVRDIIKASSKIQTFLCLKPVAVSATRLFPFARSSLRGFRCSLEALINYIGNEPPSIVVARIEVLMDPDGVYWPHIGSRLQNMFICQPPIHHAIAREHCHNDDNDILGSNPGVQLSSEKGLTIGDLYHKAKQLSRYHDSCRSPSGYAPFEPHKVALRFDFTECSTSGEEWDDAAKGSQHLASYLAKKEREEMGKASKAHGSKNGGSDSA